MTDLPADLTPMILEGDVREVLRALPAESVQCVVTSPPYWGLRAYGTPPQVWGGEWTHAHEWTTTPSRRENWQDYESCTKPTANLGHTAPAVGGGEVCACGAWRGELGLEPTPDLYVDHLSLVFAEVRRVLRSDGTVWLNIGDTYATHPAGLMGPARWKASTLGNVDHTGQEQAGAIEKRAPGLKEKDLALVPARVALRLQADGWYVRSDVIWAKPNPMPQSVRDRPSMAHEYVFLITKSPRYFYDADAVRLQFSPVSVERAKKRFPMAGDGGAVDSKWGNDDQRARPLLGSVARATGGYAPSTVREILEGYDGRATKDYATAHAQDPSATKARIITGAKARLEAGLDGGANLKTVWWITTEAFPGAHFATFPQALAEICVRAGTSERGACARCGTPWIHEVRATGGTIAIGDWRPDKRLEVRGIINSVSRDGTYRREDRGYRPGCECGETATVPCIVLDPFAGSGTVLRVARGRGRRSIGIELKPEYVEIARRRAEAAIPSLERWA